MFIERKRRGKIYLKNFKYKTHIYIYIFLFEVYLFIYFVKKINSFFLVKRRGEINKTTTTTKRSIK